MKKNGRKKKVKPADEIRRFNKNEGHPSYVYEKQGKQFSHFMLTSKRRTRGKLNEPLYDNPEPGNKDTSYFRVPPRQDPESSFSKPLSGWKMSEDNKKKLEQFKPKDKKDRH